MYSIVITPGAFNYAVRVNKHGEIDRANTLNKDGSVDPTDLDSSVSEYNPKEWTQDLQKLLDSGQCKELFKPTQMSIDALVEQRDKMRDQLKQALNIITQDGGIDGDHHKAWVLDQVVRILTNCPTVTKNAVDVNKVPYSYEALSESEEYLEFVRQYNNGEDGPNTYEYSEGIAP